MSIEQVYGKYVENIKKKIEISSNYYKFILRFLYLVPFIRTKKRGKRDSAQPFFTETVLDRMPYDF